MYPIAFLLFASIFAHAIKAVLVCPLGAILLFEIAFLCMLSGLVLLIMKSSLNTYTQYIVVWDVDCIQKR